MDNLQGKVSVIALQHYPEGLQNFALLPALRGSKHSLFHMLYSFSVFRAFIEAKQIILKIFIPKKRLIHLPELHTAP